MPTTAGNQMVALPQSRLVSSVLFIPAHLARSYLDALRKGTVDLDGTFERVQASGAEVVQEPIDQPYGIRDCAFRDPAGNHIHINQLL